ncbi:MAG: type II toxin-antitoxin system VapC family toxin [Acidimicrobiia bacterium]
MNAETVWYVDSSAIVKLVAKEPETQALSRFLERRRPLVSSGLASTEVQRAVLPLGDRFLRQAKDVLARFELVRVSNDLLEDAGRLEPTSLRSLDAIHLATAALFGNTLGGVISYDGRMRDAAASYGWSVHAPV